MLIAARDFQFVELAWRTRAADRAALREMLRSRPPVVILRRRIRIYFVDRPEHNRLFGNRALAHDEFAYQAFEAVGVAESRSSWLEPALRTGEVHVVVVPDDRTTVLGLREIPPGARLSPGGSSWRIQGMGANDHE